jgi:hypothetical protein
MTPQWTTARATKKNGYVTIRDMAILQSLSTARYLTIEALEWLHSPGWFVRWQRHQDSGSTRPYYPSTRFYHRLMYLEDQDLIGRIRRTTQIGGPILRREPDAFFLTEAGAQLISRTMNVPVEELTYFRKRPRSYVTLSHGVLIGCLYAALAARIETKLGLRLVGWQGEHVTAKSYDKVTVHQRDAEGRVISVPVAVQPDATFCLEHPGGRDRIFVEVDRDTRPLRTWVSKMQGYAAYQGSAELKARYGVDHFVLLTITTSIPQQQALMESTAGVVKANLGRYLFGLEQTVHPTQVGRAWSKIAQVTPSRNPRRPNIQATPHVFISDKA